MSSTHQWSIVWCRTTTWLIVSLQEVMLHDICSLSPTDSTPIVSCIVFDPLGLATAVSPSTRLAKDAAHLQQLITACDADFMLCVVSRAFDVQVYMRFSAGTSCLRLPFAFADMPSI